MTWRTTSDDLYRLIKSLTHGEKKHLFSKAKRQTCTEQSRSKGNKKYLDLFRFIDQMQEWNPEALNAKYSVLYNGSFQVLKNYLYRLILKTLNEQNPDHFCSQIQAAETLLDRGLLIPARRELHRIEKKAVQEEQFERLQGIYQLDLTILSRMDGKKAMEAANEVLLKREANFADWVHLEKLKGLREKIGWMAQSYPLGSKGFQDAIEKTEMATLVGHGNVRSDRFRIELETLRIQCMIQLAKANHLQAGECSREILALFEERAFLKKEMEYEYFQRHLSLARQYLETGEEANALEIIDQLVLSMTSTKGYRDLKILSQYYSLILCRVKSSDQAQALAQVVNHEPAIPQPLEKAVCYGLAFFHWSMGNIQGATTWINRYKRLPRVGRQLRMDLEVRILSLLIHFDKGHFELVNCEIDNAKGFNMRHGIANEEIAIFLNGLRCCLNVWGTDSFSAQVKKVLSKLEGIPSEEKHKGRILDVNIFLPWLNLKAWLQSKIGLQVVE